MLQPGRTYSPATYRYGFNGKEKDGEIKGEGNQIDYGERIYDPRRAGFLSIDPLTSKYPELTPYQYASNRPIDGVDLDGLEWQSNNDQKGRIRNATQSDWDNNPGKAFLKDASAYLLNWFTPAGAIDDAVDTWRKPTSNIREKGQAVMDVLMAPGFPEKPNSGHVQAEPAVPALGVPLPERPVVESPNSTQPVNATNKNATTAHSGNINAAESNNASQTQIKYSNGWRTPDGKFTSPLEKNFLPGANAEQEVWNNIKQKPGWSITTGRVYVKDAQGNIRVYDGVATSPSGNNIGLEIKSGNAKKTASQRSFDSNLNSSTKNTANGVGKNNGMTVKRSVEIRKE